jgi:integrase/recombinase XerD
MNGGSGIIAPLVQAFFADYLVRQRRASPQTVASYRDTFRLLLQHLSQATSKKPSDLNLEDMQAKAILQFLDNIEKERGNSIQTRNARLAAIRSFFRLVALRDPAHIDLAAQVLSIPVKRADRRLIGYLTRPEIEAILATPDTATWSGQRDYALLLTLYNTGARISETLALRQDQLSISTASLVHFKGKECHSYCISFRRRNETMIIHACRQACDLAFSLADVLRVVRTGIGLGPCTDAHGVGRVGPMCEPFPA